MKSLKCSELSGMACDFEATGETEEDVLRALLEHGMANHQQMLGSMTDDQKVQLMEKAKQMISEK